MINRLRQIENHLQTIIEGTAARLFPSSQSQYDLASRLAAAMQSQVKYDVNGRLIGPNLFILGTSPDQARLLSEDHALINQLMQALEEESDEAGILFEPPLVIRVVGFDEIPPGELRIQAYHSHDGLPQTAAMASAGYSEPEQMPMNAFFIVDGTQIYSIKHTILNIGRRGDNHLIIDDPRISRVHAQLRYVHGQFIISDLDSSGGTFVNGERIHQKILTPGDVISLSGLPLVFGQEQTNPGDTQEVM